MLALAAALAMLLPGCSRHAGDHAAAREGAEVARPRRALPIEWRADSAQRVSMPAAPRPAPAAPRLTLERVSASRRALQAMREATPPAAAPAEPPAPMSSAGDALPADDALHAPIPRAAAQLARGSVRAGVVEVDVHVDEQGEVSEVQVVASSGDPALVAAAIDAASAMHFFPATRRGRPVAVWCRQRFAVGE